MTFRFSWEPDLSRIDSIGFLGGEWGFPAPLFQFDTMNMYNRLHLIQHSFLCLSGLQFSERLQAQSSLFKRGFKRR